ncbi:hypothetical protein SDC9_143226 [bioreactor metagenome]|uniref:Uncharacterized protein n=1 Tax=bioreactor metagenome TaxID=1076179 RepID=A0A645E3F6_9ZZZZ
MTAINNMLIVPDFIVSLAMVVVFVTPKPWIVVTTMMPKAKEANASIVLYPSKKPLKNAPV